MAVVTVVGASLEATDDAVDTAPPDDVGAASDEAPEAHPAVSNTTTTRLPSPPIRCLGVA